VRAESGMGESATEALRGRALEVIEGVVDAADIEPGMTPHDLVRTRPDRLVGDQPQTVGFTQFGRLVHVTSMLRALMTHKIGLRSGGKAPRLPQAFRGALT